MAVASLFDRSKATDGFISIFISDIDLAENCIGCNLQEISISKRFAQHI